MKLWSPPKFDPPPKKPTTIGFGSAGPFAIAVSVSLILAWAMRRTGIMDDIKNKLNNTSNSQNAITTITSPGIPEMNHTLHNHMRNMGHEQLEFELREAHNHEIYGVRNLKERLAVLQNNRHTH